MIAIKCISVFSSQTDTYPLIVRVLDRFVLKLVGLLFTDSSATPVLLVGCSSIHTWFMTYPIDVAFIDVKGRVVLSKRRIVPFRKVSVPGTYFVLERPSSMCDKWYETGDRVKFARCGDMVRC